MSETKAYFYSLCFAISPVFLTASIETISEKYFHYTFTYWQDMALVFSLFFIAVVVGGATMYRLGVKYSNRPRPTR